MYKYIIMCGGKYNHWESPRQLTKLNGEPIISRTYRLLSECGIPESDIFVSTNIPEIQKFCENHYIQVLWHENNWVVLRPGKSTGYWCDAFYPTEEPTCYLMGDVVFSKNAIAKIISTDTNDIEFFASAPPFSKIYPKPYAEPFAFKVVNIKHLREAQEQCRKLADQNAFRRRPIAWEFWQVVKGTHINKIDYTNYTAINDYTCDIDNPKDIEKFLGISLD